MSTMSGTDDRDAVDLTESVVALRMGLALSGLQVQELWLSYLEVGGGMSLGQLVRTLRGRRALTPYEHDMVAQALNDHFIGCGEPQPVAPARELGMPRKKR